MQGTEQVQMSEHESRPDPADNPITLAADRAQSGNGNPEPLSMLRSNAVVWLCADVERGAYLVGARSGAEPDKCLRLGRA